jgi:hypothetical protein
MNSRRRSTWVFRFVPKASRPWTALPWSLALLVFSCGLAVNGVFGQASTSRGGTLTKPQATTILRGPCSADRLQLKIQTGPDDLRGRGNNLNIEVHFADGHIQFANNVNMDATWPAKSIETVNIPINPPVSPAAIRQIRLIHDAHAHFPYTEDGWDVREVNAYAMGNGQTTQIGRSYQLHHLTSSIAGFAIDTVPTSGCAAPQGQITELQFTFKTGDDDLRGANSLNLTVNFADGTKQFAPNINQSWQWPEGSTKIFTLLLHHPVLLNRIKSVTLQTQDPSDNWNLNSLQIDASGNGIAQSIGSQGFFRFGGSAQPLTVTVK